MPADGYVTISTELDNKKLEKDLMSAQTKVEKLERQLNELRQSRASASEGAVFAKGELEKEQAKLREMRDTLAEMRYAKANKELAPEARERAASQIPIAQAEIAEQQRRVNELKAEWSKANTAVERYDNKIKTASASLEEQKTRAGELVEQIEQARASSNGMGAAIDKAGAFVDKFTARVKKLASRVFVFTLITMALRQLRTWLSSVISTNEEASKSLARLKAALLTLAQPLLNVVIPAFTTFINILTRLVTALASVVSKLFGSTLKGSADAAKSLYDEQQALEGVGDAAKKAGDNLQGFDEINKISDTDTGASASGSTSTEKAPDFAGMISMEMDKLAALTAAGLLAVGLILTFSGNLPLGLALIALGAAGLYGYATENWSAISEALQSPIGDIVILLSGMALVLGAVLAFSGVNVPLGLSLLAMGAIGMGANIAANWDSISAALQDSVGAIVGIVSGALIAIGAVLLFSGANIPLGLGMLATGMIGLAATYAANWDTIVNVLQSPIGTLVTILSAALLVIGIILLMSGVGIPLGLGLIAVGAIGLGTAAAANWNTIVEALQGPIGAIALVVSAALLVLGIILLFTGAGIPLGLGLIAAGAIGLAATIAPNWNFILDKVKGAWSNVKNWWNQNVSKFFTAKYWVDLGKSMISGLLNGLGTIFTGLKNWAGSVWDTITGFFTGKSKSSSTSTASTSGSRTYSTANIPPISRYQVPKLAKGAVIPANREFLAVLGDQKTGNNIEAPESLIRDIFAGELNKISPILLDILQAIQNGKALIVDKKVLASVMIAALGDSGRAGVKIPV